jgi:aminoglycoside 3-N-acetyltransferase I
MVRIARLTATDRAVAREMFLVMAAVFETDGQSLGDAYLDGILDRADFWAIAAFVDGRVVGGLRAHELPMTTSESAELFIYDIAVQPAHQRRGLGRQLMAAAREGAAAQGIDVLFVPAENEDTEALEFYRALGGVATPSTVFTFSSDAD